MWSKMKGEASGEGFWHLDWPPQVIDGLLIQIQSLSYEVRTGSAVCL